MGGMEIFGSYIEKDRSLLGEAILVTALDTFVAIVSGLIIFPACFTYNNGVTADASTVGAGFLFTTLSSIFNAKYRNGFRRDDIKYPNVDSNSLAVINYTSGTTGFSKGVMLSYNNLCGNVIYGINANLHFRGSRCVSFLPLAHAYGCAFDMLVPLAVGTHITLLGKLPSPKILLKAMSEIRPNLVICVPLILEKIYRKQIHPCSIT